MQLKYQSIFQALRGVAVLLVIFYHCGIVLTGGFVGVDVFFVLSGFLITASVMRDLSSPMTTRSFLLNFFERRVLRLVPAICTTTFVTLMLSILIFSPYDEFGEISKSAIASLLFIANARFFLRNDYVSLTADPFRHMWSLAVEEQFYICFPIFIVLIYRIVKPSRRQQSLIWSVIVVIIVSFVSSLLLSGGVRITPLPERFAFFSPITRGWQIGIGVLLALLEIKIRQKKIGHGFAVMLSVCGFALILYAGVTFDPYGVGYPGVPAIVPVLGAVLVIVSGLVATFKNTFPLRFLEHLGDLSFSLYLIHWPLLVIGQRAFSDVPSVWIASILLSYTLALMQYRWVEQVFWSPRRDSQLSTL